MHKVIVVVKEKFWGSSGRNGMSSDFRNTRSPEIEVVQFPLRQKACQSVEDELGRFADHRHVLHRRPAIPDDHVIVPAQCQHFRQVMGRICAIRIKNGHIRVLRLLDAALERRAITHILRVPVDRRARGNRFGPRVVGGAVIDDDNLVLDTGRLQCRANLFDGLAHGAFLIICRNHN